MVTKTININGSEIAVNDGYRKVVTVYCLESEIETLGSEGYKNADRAVAIDTSNVYIFDETGKKWWKA